MLNTPHDHDHDHDHDDDHDHDHDDHDHDHDHDDDHDHAGPLGGLLRIALATLILGVAIAAACIVMVPAGEAVVITRFGDPVRVITSPGLAWKLPLPIEATIPIDLRLRGTRDGLRVLIQAYTAWQVPTDPAGITQFLRSVRNQPDEAARQLRSFTAAALHIAAANYNLSDLVNSDQSKVQLAAFETSVHDQIAQRILAVYGIDIRQVGVERLTLPAETLAATVARMKAERETVAAERTADGLREAAAIRADADRDGREVVAKAQEKAAQTLADAEQQAAKIYAAAYQSDPTLYTTLRSLDAVGKMVNKNTSVIMRTDAAPFNVLVNGPTAIPPVPDVSKPAKGAR